MMRSLVRTQGLFHRLLATAVVAGSLFVLMSGLALKQTQAASPSEAKAALQLPVAMEFVGRPFEEAKLFEIASAYERSRRHRRPPTSFGRLPGEP